MPALNVIESSFGNGRFIRHTEGKGVTLGKRNV